MSSPLLHHALPLLLLLFSLARSIHAARIAYAGRYTLSSSPDQVQKYIRSSTIPNAHADAVIDKVPGWSEGRFRVSVSGTGIITVLNVEAVGSKREAKVVVGDMRDLVAVIIEEEEEGSGE